MKLSIIILAGGKSQRMGTRKQLLPWGKLTMLQHVINVAKTIKPLEIIVVLGYKSEEIIKTIENSGVKIVVNPDFQMGMSSSLRSALPHVSQKSEAIMFMLGDQPLITSKTIKLLLSKYLSSNTGIVIPTYQGKRGRPVIFNKKYINELQTLSGDIGASQVIDRHPEDITEVVINSDEIIVDIDTMDDYQKYYNRTYKNLPN